MERMKVKFRKKGTLKLDNENWKQFPILTELVRDYYKRNANTYVKEIISHLTNNSKMEPEVLANIHNIEHVGVGEVVFSSTDLRSKEVHKYHNEPEYIGTLDYTFTTKEYDVVLFTPDAVFGFLPDERIIRKISSNGWEILVS